MIAVVDYGAGNLRSVTNALVKLGYQPKVTSEPDVVLKATAVIFTGVGAAADAVDNLRGSGMDEAIKEVIRNGKPFFAVCVGMQVLLSSTEEGGWNECLGIIPGNVKRLPSGIKVPHMGWNNVRQAYPHPLWSGIQDGSRFYFVHSYFVAPTDPGLAVGYASYPFEFVCACARDNIFAVQFHPEKSAVDGLQLLTNFMNWDGTL
jgi:glutamine amidotransferase